ncbi:MAG: DUF86 domain-containing protein [Candidatus Bathyarchaeia archaeon]
MSKNHLERNPRLYLSEILEFIERIREYTQGMSYTDFVKNRQVIDAVDANVRNIGEAVRVLAKNRRIRNLFYQYRVPYRKLAGMRTDLTHQYFAMSTTALWTTATRDLLNLKPQFEKVLEESE